jgi:hypothetical protein
MLAVAAVCVVLALRSSAPGSSTLSVLLGRGLEKLGRDQTSLLPTAFSHLLNIGALLAATAALASGGGELGLVLAACLAARGALDVPIPALLLELGALYLPFVRSAATPPGRGTPPTAATPPGVATPPSAVTPPPAQGSPDIAPR